MDQNLRKINILAIYYNLLKLLTIIFFRYTMYTFIHLLNNVTSTSYGSKQHRSMVLGPVTTWSGAASGDNRLPVYTLQTNCYFRYSAMVAFDQV